MLIENPKQAKKFLEDSVEAYAPVKRLLELRVSVDRCMYSGAHWMPKGGILSEFTMTATGRKYTSSWNPDSKILATINRIPREIHKTAAATFIDKLECDVQPPQRDTGINASEMADTLEDLVNAATDFVDMIPEARTTNFRRCIDGLQGLGLRIRRPNRSVAGNDEYDSVLQAFSFDPTRLTLDPGNQSLDLDRHEYVIFSDVWTVEKINRELGLSLDPDDCAVVGDLLAMEMTMNRLSQNRLYSMLGAYSKSKGAVVHQIHYKGQTDRFDYMLVAVQTVRGDPHFINLDDQETPFGGCGMPFVLFHGHRQADSMWSWSDVSQLKDDQDRLNVLGTFFFRMLQANAGTKWIISKESLDGGGDPDEFRNQFNNLHAGLIIAKTGDRNRPIPPPQLVKTPDVPPWINEAMRMYEDEMPEQVHRSGVTSGDYKTHTSSKTFETAVRNANQVLGNRIAEDLGRYGQFQHVMAGTVIKLAKEGSPFVLSELRRRGFDEQDFANVVQMDESLSGYGITIRESSVRYRDVSEKKQDLMAAATLPQPAVTPSSLRIALADLDVPLDEYDRDFHAQARKSALRVMRGEEWQPIALGEYSEMFIKEFRRARFDRNTLADPDAAARIDRAIQNQMAFDMQVQQAQALAENPQMQQAAPQPVADEPDAAPPTEVSLSDLMTMMKQQGGQPIVSAQPAAA